MKVIRILHVVSELGNGGVESMLMNIYRNIDRNNYQFDFITHSKNDKFIDEIYKLGGRVFYLDPMSEVGIFKYSKQLYNLLVLNKDIYAVHSHILLQNAIILSVARLAKIKKRISHSHLTSFHSLKSKLASPILKFFIAMNSTDKVACGKEAGRLLYGNSEFKVLNNAIELKKFINIDDNRKLFKEENNIDEDTIVIGHVGRFVEQKNHNFIINLANVLRNKFNVKFKIFLVGNGPKFECFKNEINKHGFSDDIIMLGARSDVNKLLKSFDIFILPSLFEGLPVILVESQAAGIPSIVSSTITNEVDLNLGLLKFAKLEDNYEEWCNLIIKYHDMDRPPRSEITNKFREYKYDIESSIESVYKLYSINNQ